jgi:hypothetical protein
MLRFSRPGMMSVLDRSVAPLLLLITPFVIFVHYQGYSFLRPEVIILVLAIAALSVLLGVGAAWSPAFEVVMISGLLTLFTDIQLEEPSEKLLLLMFIGLCGVVWLLRQHAARIVSLMMATVLALSILTPRPTAAMVERPAPKAERDLPLILHLVLDEHIGVEGLPRDLAPPAFDRRLQAYFVERGFRLFGRAYSEYPTTVLSLSHLVNLMPGGYVRGLTAAGEIADRYRVTRNAYFDRLANLGYAVRVHQPDYLDLCTGQIPPTSCHTYNAKSLDVLQRLPASTSEKASVIAGTYLARAEAYRRVKRTYRGVSQRLEASGIELPAWDWERGNAAPLSSMPLFDTVATELSKAQRGDFLFAHLLIPHYAYVYDTGCRPRPPSQWLARKSGGEADVSGGFSNTRSGRARRYALYFEQMVCAQQKIGQLLDAIPSSLREDAIVIIQGDHGSRISLVDPVTVAASQLAASDYADHFSTLFAVRSPHLEPAYDTTRTPITCLLRTLVEHDFQSLTGLDGCSAPNVVFLQDSTKPRALPSFGAERGPALARVGPSPVPPVRPR